MTTSYQEVRIRGKDIKVPAAEIEGRTVTVMGGWLKIARVRDEELVEGGVVPDPATFVPKLKQSGLKADILNFPAAIDQKQPQYDFPFQWDNVAMAETVNFDKWWNKLPQETRKNARRATKKGVTVEVAKLDDAFVEGIKRIYDEAPVRQGRPFWHYQKSLERVRLENATYLDRSEFIGAYFEGQLIGFMKWVYVDKAAIIMQILSMNSHYDKRPMNALVAKAIEVCQARGAHYLVYSKFSFGNKLNSQLAEFKRRLGFEKNNFPRYYVPLTLKGRIAIKLRLHLSLIEVLPPKMIEVLLKIRAALMHFTPKEMARRRALRAAEAAAPVARPAAETAEG